MEMIKARINYVLWQQGPGGMRCPNGLRLQILRPLDTPTVSPFGIMVGQFASTPTRLHQKATWWQ